MIYLCLISGRAQVELMWWFGLVVWGVWEILSFDIFMFEFMMFLSCLLGH